MKFTWLNGDMKRRICFLYYNFWLNYVCYIFPIHIKVYLLTYYKLYCYYSTK